jgi:tetratricopeptide (TPR) repeat protein
MKNSKSDIKNDIQKLKKLRQYEEAAYLCTQAIEAHSNDYEWYEIRSEILKRKGDYEGAFSDLEKVIELMPNDMAPVFRRGRWSFEQGKYNQTVKDMSAIISVNNLYFKDSAYYFRAQAFYFLCDYKNALSDCMNTPEDFSLGLDMISRNELLNKILLKKDNRDI